LSSAPGPEIFLNAASHYVSNIFLNTLTSLEVISSTPEAGQGNWKGIKKYLSQLKSRLPGTYFYVLPDGNYYSVEKDCTGLNLSDRDYFESLLMGESVRGFLLQGRSSGKKSCMVAAPILLDSQATGALGASVHLDDLQAELNLVFGLPEHYTWFILDSHGNTILDSEQEFIFMNALTQGTSSMQQAVRAALKGESGEVRYEHGGIMRHAWFQKMPEMDWWMFLAEIQAP
ncbi:MAG: cache domain-containing protein, partial [Desulfonatronovibrio sp.]